MSLPSSELGLSSPEVSFETCIPSYQFVQPPAISSFPISNNRTSDDPAPFIHVLTLEYARCPDSRREKKNLPAGASIDKTRWIYEFVMARSLYLYSAMYPALVLDTGAVHSFLCHNALSFTQERRLSLSQVKRHESE
ncbi:hypothetical protein BV898_19637 [Hypsibius exemplaris]|uniref:Uncharacterized protein n=1 Tax=Hypsibius exemplaris TaxID=2072580 RepID=A0A9X6RP47_HYPEX|nr:hypothetical protein BV898_19637 [Hypsibius exemplaris]